MITLVIILNGLIAFAGFFAAWQIWKLRRTLANITHVLDSAENNSHNLLYNAPENIIKGQTGTYQLRQSYRALQPQIEQAQKLLGLLGVVLSLWNRRSPISRRLKSFKRPSSRRR